MQPPPPAQDPPAQALEPSLVPRDVRSLPRLRDMAATFPFADSNSNEAEHRHTHWPGWSLRLPTGGAAFNSTCIQESNKTQA